MTEQWYSIVEYARTYSVSDMTVRRHIKTGKLKAVLKDGKYYIPMDKLLSKNNFSEISEGLDSSICQKDTPTSPIEKLPSQMQLMKSKVTSERSQVNPHKHLNNFSSFEQDTPRNFRDCKPLIKEAVMSSKVPRDFVNFENSFSDSRDLLGFCREALDKLTESEKHLVEKYVNKINSLECQISKKDLEINTLKQQVEDLQLLVKIVEKRSL